MAAGLRVRADFWVAEGQGAPGFGGCWPQGLAAASTICSRDSPEGMLSQSLRWSTLSLQEQIGQIVLLGLQLIELLANTIFGRIVRVELVLGQKALRGEKVIRKEVLQLGK